MNGSRDFRGQSGAVYRYQRVEPQGPAPLGAGNYLYVRADKATPVIVFAGECERLSEAIGTGWRDAVDKHGATDIFARKTVAYRARQEELQDVLAEHAPVMNDAAEISAARKPAVEAVPSPPEEEG